MNKFICPLCSEGAVSSCNSPSCLLCGKTMERITGSLVATLRDRPGALAEFSQQFAKKGINIKTLRVITQKSSEAVVLFSVDRFEEALTIPGVKQAEDFPSSLLVQTGPE